MVKLNKIPSNADCPCDSHDSYEHCCGRYISGQENPPTAKSLMRSRYTAYTQANIAYIQKTMRDKAAEQFDPISAETWAKTVKWKRLKVIRAFPGPSNQIAYVEFIAHYLFEGKAQKLSEISEFKQIDGRWYYVDSR